MFVQKTRPFYIDEIDTYSQVILYQQLFHSEVLYAASSIYNCLPTMINLVTGHSVSGLSAAFSFSASIYNCVCIVLANGNWQKRVLIICV